MSRGVRLSKKYEIDGHNEVWRIQKVDIRVHHTGCQINSVLVVWLLLDYFASSTFTFVDDYLKLC